MLKSVNQLVTERCNSKCKMCGIWRVKTAGEMTPEEFDRLYSHPEFASVEDLCISGGEPTLRKDLLDVTDKILAHLPKLRMLFLSTNGSDPSKAREFMERYSPAVEDIYICPSIEGSREIHAKIRGVDTYSSVLETIKEVKGIGADNIHVVLSMTLTPENCNEDSLSHVRHVAEENGCTYSFRPASRSDTFYKNGGCENLSLAPAQIDFVKKYMFEHKISDPFLDMLFSFLNDQGTIMGSREKGIECLAGDISVFVKPTGMIYPCINSTRVIGNLERGIFIKDYDVGDHEPCPCCTECQIYPMINFHQHASKSRRKNGN
jgi:MoaA/NifB/PqqE/SkfB family radical SAM enzyme